MAQIVLTGRTGSGKTSVARQLSERTGCPHISSGDIVRKLAKEDPDFERTLTLGLFAPEEQVRERVKAELEAAQIEDGGWVLEGFPRKVEQLALILGWLESPPTFVLLDCPRLTCIQRLVRRGRADDNADAISEKLKGFELQTMPMLDILDEADWLYNVDAERSVDDMVGELVALST